MTITPQNYYRAYASNPSYMLASAVPLLEGKKLCDFLEKMDQQEHLVLQREASSLEEKIRKHVEETKFLKIGSVCGLAGSIFGMHRTVNGDLMPFMTSLTVAALSAVCLMVAVDTEAVANPLRVNMLNNRDLRLQHKIRTINERLSLTNAQDEKEQLPCAKDYFYQKQVELMTLRTNHFTVKHTRL